jgi:hypothetical protein
VIRQLRNQDVYQGGRVRFVRVQVAYSDQTVTVDQRDERSRFQRVLTLSDARLLRTVGAVHTYAGTDEDGQPTTIKVLPNARGGCGCGKRSA